MGFYKQYNVIGLMSGTSLDGVDLAFVNFYYDKSWQYQLRECQTIPYDEEWQKELTNMGKIIEKKLDITIPDKVYEKVLSKDGNLIDARKFIQSLNRAYAMDATSS